MIETILDVESERPKKKSFKLVKTGTVSGLAATALLAVSLAFIFYGSISSVELDKWVTAAILVCLFLPCFVGMFLIAAWGNRSYHFFRILGTGLIAYQTIILLMVLLIIVREMLSDIPNIYHEYIMGMFNGNVFIIFFAFLFWLIPGKLPYFRKQVDP